MRGTLMLLLPLLAWSGTASAQMATARDPGAAAPVQYDLSFPNAIHHEARITATWRNVPAGPLRVQMSRSSPGRYAIHEFAKNVYDVSARDGAGKPLTLIRTDPYGWSVAGHDGTVTVSYTLYGDFGDGTYSQIDGTHAHLNMPATMMWASGYDAQPISLRFHAFDPSWKVATQLPPSSQPQSYWAPNLQYLMDSPVELSNFMLREWKVGNSTFRLALHHEGSEADADRYAAKAEKVVKTAIATYGAPAPYDFGTYTFVADYMPQVDRDGMEHRNSTVITDARSLAAANDAQLNTLSHEFFHSWNVERVRPAELEPFDFTRANPTPSLWLAEGFTSYYGPLHIRRAGLMSVDAYLTDLSGMLNFIVNNPARAPERINASPMEMSLRAPFVDAARSIDRTNPNVFVSYYPYGAIIGLALDLELRQRFPGKSLDGFMRTMWQRHGATERSYRISDAEAALAAYSGDPAFATAFFDRSIRGDALPDFAPLLRQAGLTLQRADPTAGWIGNSSASAEGASVTLDQSPAQGTPLYQAGLERGDRIVSLGGTAVTSAAEWQAALKLLKSAEALPIRFVQRGRERSATITPMADPKLTIVRGETAGAVPTKQQLAFRHAWLGQD